MYIFSSFFNDCVMQWCVWMRSYTISKFNCVRLSQQSIHCWSEQITSTNNCSCTSLRWRHFWLRLVNTPWRKWKSLLRLLQLQPVRMLRQVPSIRQFSSWHKSTVGIVVLHLKILAKSFRWVSFSIAYIFPWKFCTAVNVQFDSHITNTKLNCNNLLQVCSVSGLQLKD